MATGTKFSCIGGIERGTKNDSENDSGGEDRKRINRDGSSGSAGIIWLLLWHSGSPQ